MVTLQEIHAVLLRVDFPATKEDIIRHAIHLEAPASILKRFYALPEHRYGSVDSVMDALRRLE